MQRATGKYDVNITSRHAHSYNDCHMVTRAIGFVNSTTDFASDVTLFIMFYNGEDLISKNHDYFFRIDVTATLNFEV